VGTFAPGTVATVAIAVAPSGSISAGGISISGAHVGPNENTATVSGAAFIAPAVPVGSASFGAVATDPYPYAMDDQSPFPQGTQIGFTLILPAAGNSLPPIGSLGNWSVSYASYIADINTSDVDTFYGANPDLLYSLTLSDSAAGFAVNFVPGSPSGFPVTFSETPSQIDADVLAALEGGFSSDLTAVRGEIDVSGHTSATIGAEGEIHLEGGVPEPAPMLPIGAGLMGISLVWRRRLKVKG
jgi:hypothetical protein